MAAATQNAANLLTLARLLCVPVVVLLIVEARYPEAAALFLLAALTDLADGFVAKRLTGSTALGAVLDPLADKLLMAGVLVALVAAGHLPLWLAVLVIGRDLLIVAGALALRLSAGPFRVEPLLIGKFSTFVQLVLGGTVLAQLAVWPDLGRIVPHLVLLTAAAVVVSAVAYLHAARRIWLLARVER